MRVVSPIVWFLPLAIAACSSPGSGEPTSDSVADAISAGIDEIPGPELARCWFEEYAPGDGRLFFDLGCTRDRIPESSGLTTVEGPGLIAVGLRREGHAVDFERIPPRGGTTYCGVARLEEFPRVVLRFRGGPKLLDRSYIAFGSQTFGDDAPTGPLLWQDFPVDWPSSLPADAPLRVRVPYDLWPIVIVNRGESAPYEVRASYSVSVAPLLVGEASEIPAAVWLKARLGTRRLVLPKPKDGVMEMTFTRGGTSTSTLIDRPGVFVFDDATVRRAAPEEIARMP